MTTDVCLGAALLDCYDRLSTCSADAQKREAASRSVAKTAQDRLFLHCNADGINQRFSVKRINDYAASEKKDIQFFSSFHFASSFSCNPSEACFASLLKIVELTLKLAPTLKKYLLLNIGDHALGLFCEEKQWYLVDHNLELNGERISGKTDDLILIAKHLARYNLEKDFLSLGIELVTTEKIEVTKEQRALFNPHLQLAPKQKSYEGFTPFLIATLQGWLDSAEELLRKGTSIDETYLEQERTPLFIAANENQPDIVQFLLEARANPDIPEKAGACALYRAAEFGLKDVVDALVKGKADLNAKEPTSGFTPLFVAAAYGHEGVVSRLLTAGADPTIVDVEGISPKDAALEMGQHATADLIEASLRKQAHS